MLFRSPDCLQGERAERHRVGLHGPAGNPAADAGAGLRPGGREAPRRPEVPAGLQLGAGAGRRHRLQPHLLPAPPAEPAGEPHQLQLAHLARAKFTEMITIL